jgi:TonB family protein
MRQITLSLTVAAAVCAACTHYTPTSERDRSDFWPSSVRNDSRKLDSTDPRYLVPVLRKQLYGCWNRPPGVSGIGADAPSAIVRFKLKRDGSLAGAPVVVGSHADPSQAVAKTALAAVRRCQPFSLPPNLYEFWEEVEVNFVTNAPN